MSERAATLAAMGFFEGLTTPDPEPVPAPPEEFRLPRYAPPAADGGEEHPPEQWFAPAWVEQLAEAGRGAEARIMVNGWEVYRHSATLRLNVFLRVTKSGGGLHQLWQRSSGGLRCGLLFADGRRITTLDGQPYPGGSGGRPTLSLRPGMGGGHHYAVNLHLSRLPPEGDLDLVVEWPDQGVPETHTGLDAAAVLAASRRAVEVWPDLAPPPARRGLGRGLGPVVPADVVVFSSSGGASDLLAPRPAPQPYSPPAPPPPVHEQGDWEGLGRTAFQDLALIRARMAHGADPEHRFGEEGTVLHLAAECGSAEVVGELARNVADVDVRSGFYGDTPLWRAVCAGNADSVAALLAAGADAWTPLVAGRSAGSLALRTPMAPLVKALPGYVPLTDAERAEQADADADALVFRGIHTEGVSVAFVAGVSEEDVVRRLGSDPERSPVLDLDVEPGPYGTGPGGFDPYEYETSLRFLGVTGVEGGCVVVQPMGYRASTPAVLAALSPGARAYGLYFNPKGGTFGRLSVDGRDELQEEIGMRPGADAPEPQWLYRLWSWGRGETAWSARELAYSAAMAGLRIADGAVVSGPPRRWVELPEGSALLKW
ncbi:ankyrin repeat domain-containing protein [Yinghuangia seranimata]|uniref:ankyrin repeat domain-containing protein n=1 Tax=Yinghuangia seranimata TaxID=408067 RepID=UPI00248CBD3F|nr:ankyrin repeat domain-containing protein [Yinghuangia seranimata]MDI2127105.1 ankyrin repeat domain-containing protein [Yinghuangia seranimata]